MIIKEAYTHTRNYGCRIRKYSSDGIGMVSIENRYIKAVFALDKGTDLVELVYKPEDVDFMWHSFNELKNIRHQSTVASESGNFLDSYAGGWQDLFPTYGGPSAFHGGKIGIHGEACLYPWECEMLTDTPECVSLKFSLRLMRSPFYMEKIVTLTEESQKLQIIEKITNQGSTEQSFMWGQHPAFGWPFIDEHTRLNLKGTPTVTVPQSTIAQRCPFDKETSGTWPFLQDKEGNRIDMSRAYAHEDRIYMEYALSNLQEGAYELVNEKTGLGIRMEWDLQRFPYLWVWGMYCGHEDYPWYGRAYTMAVEPWSSMPGDYETAAKNGTVLSLAAGESMETEITAELFCGKERN